MTNEERQDIRRRFDQAVNMDIADLSSWLRTKPSKEVGWPKNRRPGEESVGHASGRHIVRILKADTEKLSETDYRHMRKVSGFVARHLKQRPKGDVSHTRWRYSLMNWGHDPLQ